MQMRSWKNAAGVGAFRGTACAALLTLVACSSSSNNGSPDSGSLFGGQDSGSSTTGGGHTTASQGSGHSSARDAGSPTSHKDAACGAVAPTEDWCDLNAPALTKNSNIFCEDFDTGVPLDGNYGYSGLMRDDWVGGNFISPYCALKTFVGDGGGGASVGAYSFHAYTFAPGSGSMYVSADILVPGNSACNGATVSRIWISPSDLATNAGMAWLKVSNLQGSGATTTGYTLNLYTQGGTRPDAGSEGGKISGPVIVDVTPNAAGWARIQLEFTSYNITATASTVQAVASTNAAGDVKVAGLSSSPSQSSTGTLVAGPDTPGAEMDVGILPDPATGVAVGGCDLLVDNVVSNIP